MTPLRWHWSAIVKEELKGSGSALPWVDEAPSRVEPIEMALYDPALRVGEVLLGFVIERVGRRAAARPRPLEVGNKQTTIRIVCWAHGSQYSSRASKGASRQ
jgi:hypothetical protein